MKPLLTIILSLCFFSAFSQADYDYLNVHRRFTLANRTVKGISNDTAWLVGSADSLVTQYAVQGYIANNFSRGGSFAYNFNPEQFIQNGQDISIRFPQDPGEPLFAGSPAFNFTQQHLDFLDSLMLAVGQDTYLDDRDFYYSPDTLNPIRWKAFTFSTTGTGAASWDSANRHLNIPVSSGGSGGSSSPYHLPYNGDTTFYLAGDTSLRKLPAAKNAAYKLPYNGDSTFYLAGDSALHPLPPTPPPGDSIDYSFTSMTTIYNEAGPGEYSITTSGVTANKDNLTFPFRQLKALDIGGWSNGDYVSFANTGSANSTAYTFLRGFVRLKQTVPIIQSLSFQFYKNGAAVSQTVSMVNYGLNKSKANVYQNITIPMSAFQFTSNDFDEIRLIFGGGSSADGLYLDLFQFQNATVNENIYVTDLFKQAGTDSVYKVLGGQNVFAFRDSAGLAADTQYLRRDINLKLNIADTLNKWAAKVHTHAESDVTNLVSDLAGKEPTITAGTTLQYWRGDKTMQTLNTDAVVEATNKYYTDTRARAAITLTTTGTSGAATYNSTTGVLNVPQYATSVGTITWLGTTYNINSGNNVTLATPTTTQVTEGSNLYYTDARARGAISLTTTGNSGAATYNSTTGVLNIPSYAGGVSQWTTVNTNDIYYNQGNAGIGSAVTPTARLSVNYDNIGALSTTAATNNAMGISLENNTPSTASVNQSAPILRFRGSGWKTNATAGSQTTDWRISTSNVSAAAAPSSNISFDYSANGGAYTQIMALNTAGKLVTTALVAGSFTSTDGSVSAGASSNLTVNKNGGDGLILYPLSNLNSPRARWMSNASDATAVNYWHSIGAEIRAIGGGAATRASLMFSSQVSTSSLYNAPIDRFSIATDGGITIIPMTKAQRDALVSPAQGRVVFVSDNGGYLSYYNAGWFKVSAVAD